MGLRKGQRELVTTYRGGLCAIPAIPGGGKTHCLSLWAVEMIANGYNKPGKILIVTYMNTAVNNFKQRISLELAKRNITGNKDYFVSTIHGLCLQIIKEKPDSINVIDDFNIIDGVSKAQIINRCIDEWRKNNDDKFRTYIDEKNLSSRKVLNIYKNWQDKFAAVVLTMISNCKCMGFSPKTIKEKTKALKNHSILKICADIYELYDKKLKINGLLDFDDMLYNAKLLLEQDESLLEKYRKKYSFVCEDEAQDSNKIQNEILSLIANGNLLRVGDSNQAICGSFSNSDFTLFKEFCENKGTTVYSITESSRKTINIINLANYLVKFVTENHPVVKCKKSLIPQYIEPVDISDDRPNPKLRDYGIDFFQYNSWEDEAKDIVNKALNIKKQFPGKTISILVPNSWRISFIVDNLTKKKVQFEQLDNTSKEKNKTITIIGRIIDFIATPECTSRFILLLKEVFLTNNYDEFLEHTSEDSQWSILEDFLMKYSTEKIIYPVEGEFDISFIPENLKNSKILKDFFNIIPLIRELLEFPTTVIEKLILYISEKLNFGVEDRAIAQKIASDVRYLVNQNPKISLSDLALELLNPKNMFNFFASVVWDLKGYEAKPGIITVSTYHKSKGLEWDIVFLTGLNNSDFPVKLTDKFIGEHWFLKEKYKNPQALAKAEFDSIVSENNDTDYILTSKIETICERARLLYVGITRAREYLFLSGCNLNTGKKNEVLLSDYIIELKKYADEEKTKWEKI